MLLPPMRNSLSKTNCVVYHGDGIRPRGLADEAALHVLQSVAREGEILLRRGTFSPFLVVAGLAQCGRILQCMEETVRVRVEGRGRVVLWGGEESIRGTHELQP